MRTDLRRGEGLLLLATIKDHKSKAVDAAVSLDYNDYCMSSEPHTLRQRERRDNHFQKCSPWNFQEHFLHGVMNANRQFPTSRPFRGNACMAVLWIKAVTLQGQAHKVSEERRFHVERANQSQDSIDDLFEFATCLRLPFLRLLSRVIYKQGLQVILFATKLRFSGMSRNLFNIKCITRVPDKNSSSNQHFIRWTIYLLCFFYLWLLILLHCHLCPCFSHIFQLFNQ